MTNKTLAYIVMLSRTSLKYIQYVCVVLLRMPCLRALLHHLASLLVSPVFVAKRYKCRWLLVRTFHKKFYCNNEASLGYSVVLIQPSSKYFQYVFLVFIRTPCLQVMPYRFVENPGEISGLGLRPRTPQAY